MKSIAIAAAFGIVFALASAGFADERPGTTRSGELESGKIKPSTPLRTEPAPEAQGGMIEQGQGNIIYL